MPDLPHSPKDEDASSISHRSRPSLITNASGFAESTMSFGSVTTGEGLMRLSQFPPPPTGFPLSPFEDNFGLSSPVRTDITLTPPDTPTTSKYPMQNIVPVLQLRPTAPLVPHRKGSGPPSDRTAQAVIPTVRRLPPTPAVHSPLRTPALTVSSPSGGSSPLSPHDWHDGSSSIAVDGYEERMLSTAFITSLLSSVSTNDDNAHPPPQYTRNMYEPSVISEVLSAESAVTYPPRKLFHEPVPRTSPYFHQYPPQYEDGGSVVSGPSTLYPPPSRIPLEGRQTPESTGTFGSDAGLSSVESPVVQTAVMSRVLNSEFAAVGMASATARSISVVPSLQSIKSTTPLIPNFPPKETIQEDVAGEQTDSGPSTPGTNSRSRHSDRYRRERRQSAYSSKTTKSYVSSLVTRISHSTGGERRSIKQAANWFRKKPLPPVPRLPNISIRQEMEHRRAEAALPLPDLVNRAHTLSQMLDRGHRPHLSYSNVGSTRGGHDSMPSSAGVENFRGGSEGVHHRGAVIHPELMYSSQDQRDLPPDVSQGDWKVPPDTPVKSRTFALSAMTKRQKVCFGGGLLAVIVCIVIGVAVGVTVSHKHSDPSCPGNLAGKACNLDATCVCTSTVAGQCSQLAQNLVNLVPTLNTFFDADFTPASLSTAVWGAQGAIPGNDCTEQAQLVDVAPGLDVSASPNRTEWAQAALLWNLITSQSLPGTAQLRQFVSGADWRALSTSDGPTTESSQFVKQVLGYNFDFAAQTVTPVEVTFADKGQPSHDQLSRVNDVANTALNRMYSFALASDTQQQGAMLKYWTSVLGQQASDLKTFMSLIGGSPIMLPFDATASPDNQYVASLLTNSTSAPFPPPLGCYPGLSTAQLQAINVFESSAFELSSAAAESQFDASCFPDRPIYGVLDILRLRLPFTDARTGIATQAAILTRDASSRAVLYTGEVFSALSGTSNVPSVTSTLTDPRQFGTTNHLTHVILKYLSSITDVNVAIALVKYVLTSTAVPPTSNNAIFPSLASLPTLEVAVFGSVIPPDISSTVSSFSGPNGSLFFGTDQSLALRDWSIVAVQQSVAWTNYSASAEIVRDSSFTDDTFNAIWNSAFTFFHSNNDAHVDASNITIAFQTVGKFTPQ